ncbi:hypothetical protein DFR50_111149 [Roseiarcus fermentans]|uniref:Secreted protein with PEP-CTERM sorting signal n=1 Tax=Roseiarcus fermentans TaxID=1473586 RepID=A0A366FH03_9HYPH|nr:hypothetical protein [Roseiarcus fermentans]RBP13887.1 hypothetical protein DFR50_111149 [Roseiarcus fermentans]
MKSKLIGACALAALAAGLSTQAEADVWWQLDNVVFDDGGTVSSGQFAINIYGYILNWPASSVSVTTTAGSTITSGVTYVGGGVNYPTDDTVSFSNPANPYGRVFELQFQYALTTATADDPIIGGWECVSAADNCPGNPTSIRYVNLSSSPYAAAPEAPTWAMMILGAGLLGLGGTAMRGRLRLLAA